MLDSWPPHRIRRIRGTAFNSALALASEWVSVCVHELQSERRAAHTRPNQTHTYAWHRFMLDKLKFRWLCAIDESDEDWPLLCANLIQILKWTIDDCVLLTDICMLREYNDDWVRFYLLTQPCIWKYIYGLMTVIKNCTAVQYSSWTLILSWLLVENNWSCIVFCFLPCSPLYTWTMKYGEYNLNPPQ
jgi:hypothetical protein